MKRLRIRQQPAKQPPQKGDRLLSIAVTEAADKDFGKAFARAKKAGLQVVELPLAWDDLETAAGSYKPQPNWLEIANLFYPTQRIKVSLEVNPIDTNNLRLPKDLSGKPWDDPQVMERFQKLLDWVFTQIPKLDLLSLTIGNEIDATLGNDTRRWEQYQTFFKATAGHARKRRPGLKVGAKVTLTPLLKPTPNPAKSLNDHTDLIMTTYYPLMPDFTVKSPTVVHEDFKKLAEAYQGRTIYLLEAGYPSGRLCNSSEEKQVEFVRALFEAWDTHREQIKLVCFTWLTDISPESVTHFTRYYGVSQASFAEYLRTLGLVTHSGVEKRAFRELVQEAKKRGW